MSEGLTRRLHALAEQRCAYFIDLHQSGRWRHYYTSDELMAQMREAVRLARVWQEMVESAQDANVLAPRDPAPSDMLEQRAIAV